MNANLEFLNPDGLFKSPAFSQIVTTRGNGKTIYIGGQNAVNEKAELVGKNDIALQTGQVMKNLETALKSCGAGFDNLVKLTIIFVQGQDLRKGFEAAKTFLEQSSNRPVITGFFVQGLGNPDWLIEIDAIAFIPED